MQVGWSPNYSHPTFSRPRCDSLGHCHPRVHRLLQSVQSFQKHSHLGWSPICSAVLHPKTQVQQASQLPAFCGEIHRRFILSSMWHHRTIPHQCSLFLIFLVHCNLVVILSRPGTEVCYFPDLCFSMEWITFGLPSFISNATFPRGLVPIKNISLGKVCIVHVLYM